MSETVHRVSPLAHLFAEGPPSTGADAGVTLTERPFIVHIDLRGDPSDRAFLDAARGAVGVALPLEPNTVARGPETAALWLGPDEWLILAPPDGGGLESRIESALEGRRHAVVDVSGGQTVIGLSGGRARDVLAKGCTLDLHPQGVRSGPVRPDARGQGQRDHLADRRRTILRPDRPPQLRRVPGPLARRRLPRVRPHHHPAPRATARHGHQ